MEAIRFVILGCVFGYACELFFKIVAPISLGGVLVIVLFYPLYTLFVYHSGNRLLSYFTRTVPATILYYVLYGCLGLTLEWVFMNNSPWGNPDASQSAMFSFWATIALAPRILLNKNPGVRRVKIGIVVFFACYVIASAATLLLTEGATEFVSIIYLMIIGYNGLNIFYFWYFVRLRRVESTTQAGALSRE
ncbi:hypothetical protein ACFL2Q_05385 [Thermodesulfobacteriota bacterium]